MKLSFSACQVASFVLTALLAVGCTASSSDETAATTDPLLSVPNPSGIYFASITANGTGCPAGTWYATIAPDGGSFEIEFSEYEAMVNPGEAFSVKDCTIGIDVRSPSGISFAVENFRFQGYAILDASGMQATESAKYYFQGNPVPARENRTDMMGPYDDSFLFMDNIAPGDLVWSPCGTSRRLNAQTRLIMQNNPQKSGTGYMNMGGPKMSARGNFRWRAC